MRVLGLDAGGTKTVCVLADEAGTILSEARGPGANLTAAGEAGVERVLRQTIEGVLAGQPSEITAICLGMAGVDRPPEATRIRSILNGIVAATRVTIVNDALVALEAGAPGRPGIVIISGTGSITYGRNAAGRAARAGGWGHILADEGSGYWLGRQALRAVMRQSDGRGRPTSLTARLLSHYDVARAQDLVQQVYSGGLQPSAIATLASIVQAAAAEGDGVARRMIEVGAAELSIAAASVATRLDLSDCAVVLAGGIFRAVPRMRDAVMGLLASRLPAATVVPLEIEPAVGAVRLALRDLAGDVIVPQYLDDLPA